MWLRQPLHSQADHLIMAGVQNFLLCRRAQFALHHAVILKIVPAGGLSEVGWGWPRVRRTNASGLGATRRKRGYEEQEDEDDKNGVMLLRWLWWWWWWWWWLSFLGWWGRGWRRQRRWPKGDWAMPKLLPTQPGGVYSWLWSFTWRSVGPSYGSSTCCAATHCETMGCSGRWTNGPWQTHFGGSISSNWLELDHQSSLNPIQKLKPNCLRPSWGTFSRPSSLHRARRPTLEARASRVRMEARLFGDVDVWHIEISIWLSIHRIHIW